MRTTRWATIAVAAVAMTTGVFWPLSAQAPGAIWTGAYTAAQAERGRAVVQTHCSECHHEDLSGGEGPALVGATFMTKWETHTVERLFHKIRDTMPSRDDTDVTAQQKLDAVAFILQLNGFPAGSTELADTPGTLASLHILPKGGPAAPRAGALVQAIGCLQEASTNKWVLTQSTDPKVTTLDPLAPDDKQSAAASAPGTQTVELMSVFPSPVAMKGHKAIAKGLYITAPSGSRINVMSLESLAPSCSQ
jgi:mono/diheme cytochrome c family protein